MALQTTLAECRWPSRGSTTTKGCAEGLALGCAWTCGCNTRLDRSKEVACISLPLLTAGPTTSAEGSGGGQPSPAAMARALLAAKPAVNAVHVPADRPVLLGEKGKTARCGEGDREGWGTEGEDRAGKQLDAFLVYFFKQGTFVLCSLLQCKRDCCGAEREEGGINRKAKGAFEKENANQGGKTWKRFKGNLPLTMRSGPVSLNMLCNLL